MTVVFNSTIPVVPENGTLSATDPAVAVTTLPNASGANSQVEGNVGSGATDGGNPVKGGAVFNTTGLAALSTGQRGDMQIDNNGNLYIRIIGAAVASANNLSNSIVYATDTARNQNRPLAVAGHKHNGTGWDRDQKANTVGRLPSSAASVNATNLKGSAGDISFIGGNNANAAIRYLKLYNKATTPVVGTDAPFMTFALKPLEPFNIPLGGIYLSAGIGYGLTTGAADADVGAVAAGDILGLNIAYI